MLNPSNSFILLSFLPIPEPTISAFKVWRSLSFDDLRFAANAATFRFSSLAFSALEVYLTHQRVEEVASAAQH
ncbi:hypothetical protein M8494_19540 [Serratia ureilytica]